MAQVAQLPIGALRAAEANLRRYIALSRELGDRSGEALARHNLGGVLTEQGDAEQP